MPKLLLIDSYGLCFRSFFAMKDSPLINEKGENVSVLAGFFSMLTSIIEVSGCTHMLIAADSKTKTFRHQLYDKYKANRPKTPEDLHRQINVLLNIISSFSLKSYSVDGFEADDIIASSAEKYKKDAEVIVVSSDKDLMQLVNDKDGISQIRPANASKLEHYDEKKVYSKYLLPPSKIHLYLSILGDASDNIPGVDGVGEKGAVEILQHFSSVDEIYANLDSIKPQIAKRLSLHRDDLELSYTLSELKNDIDIPYTLSELSLNKINLSSGVNVLKSNGIKVASGRFERTIKKIISREEDTELSLF